MARWVRRRAEAGRVLAEANQERGVLERYGITREEADRSAWAIERDGRRHEGAAAINRTLALLGGAWAAAALPYRLRPVAAAEEAFYRWFARRRSRFRRFGVTPECERPDSGCV